MIYVDDHIDQLDVAAALAAVDDERREYALRYKHERSRRQCLAAYLLLQQALRLEYGITGALRLQYNEHGKPYLEGGPYFSISHCKAGIAVAIDDAPIGIDIETIRHANEDLVERTMNEKERLGIKELGMREFTRLWTQKEAIVKAEGTGIYSFEQLQTILDNGQWTLDTFEKENYIYSIAYGQLCSFGA